MATLSADIDKEDSEADKTLTKSRLRFAFMILEGFAYSAKNIIEGILAGTITNSLTASGALAMFLKHLGALMKAVEKWLS